MAPRRSSRAVLVPLAIGLAGAAMTVLYAIVDLSRAAVAWTAAYAFGVATALGALGLAFALHLAHAKWWLVVKRPLVACASTMPIFVPLFAPIALLLDRIYPWAGDAPRAHADAKLAEALAHQHAWSNPRGFVLRAILYLAVFCALSLRLRHLHARFDRTADERVLASARRLSGAGVPLLAFAGSFAAFDWVMSAEPGFASDMMGLYLLVSGLVAATSVLAIGAVRCEAAKPDHVHAIGRLLLMSVVLWAYIGFFQLLLVWIADLPREVSFYRGRAAGSWVVVDVILVVGRFALPFLLLLSRPLKRSRHALAAVAWWLFASTALEHAWLVLPASAARLSLWDIGPFACVGGLAWAYGTSLARSLSGAAEVPPTESMVLSLHYESP